MPVLDLDGLTRYDGNIKDYIGRFANWQKSEKAGAVAVYPVPETALEPTVDFLFTETPPASGDKGPDNPSTITGVTQAKVTRCGKNLIKPRNNIATQIINGVTFTVNDDGSYTVNGTASSTAYFYIAFTAEGVQLKDGCTYTLSGCPSGGGSSTFRLFIGGSINDSGSGSTFSQSGDATYNCFITVSSGYTASNLVFKPQLELGSTATSFEPYSGADYTVNLGGTFYGGSVDLSTGTMTVTHQRLVYDGTEDVRYGNTYYYFMAYSPQIKNRAAFTTTHFIATATGGIVGMAAFMGTSGVRFGWTTEASAVWATEEDLKAWLAAQYAAGTPLTVVYELAEPYTVQLTPTQIYSLSQPDPYNPRVNTVYSDQVSVQVGYAKSPIRSEYELTQAIIATEGGE